MKLYFEERRIFNFGKSTMTNKKNDVSSAPTKLPLQNAHVNAQETNDEALSQYKVLNTHKMWIKLNHNGILRILALPDELFQSTAKKSNIVSQDFSSIIHAAFDLSHTDQVIGLVAVFKDDFSENYPPVIIPITALSLGHHPLDLLPNYENEMSFTSNIEYNILLRKSESDGSSFLRGETTQVKPNSPHATTEFCFDESENAQEHIKDHLELYVYKLLEFREISPLHGTVLLKHLHESETDENVIDLLIAKSLVVSKWKKEEIYFINALKSIAETLLEPNTANEIKKPAFMLFSDLKLVFDVAEELVLLGEISKNQYIYLLTCIIERDEVIENVLINYKFESKKEVFDSKDTDSLSRYFLLSSLRGFAQTMSNEHEKYNPGNIEASLPTLSMKQILLQGIERLVLKKRIRKSDFTLLLDLFEKDDMALLSSCYLFQVNKNINGLENSLVERLELFQTAGSKTLSDLIPYSRENTTKESPYTNEVFIEEEKESVTFDNKGESKHNQLILKQEENLCNKIILHGVNLLLSQKRISKEAAGALVTSFSCKSNPILCLLEQNYERNGNMEEVLQMVSRFINILDLSTFM